MGSDNFLYAAGLEPSAVPGLLQGFIWKVNPVTMTTAGFGGGSGRLMLADPARSYAFTRVKEYGGKIFASGFTHAIDEPAGNTDWFLAVFDRATGNLLATHTAFDTSGGDACNDEINDIHVGASGVYIVGQVLLGQCVAPVSMVQRLTVAADGTLALAGSWSTVAGVEFADGWAIDGTTSGDVYVASRVFKLVGGVAVADWRLNRLRVCTTGTLLCSTHQADAGLNDGSSYNMPRSIAVTSGSSPKLVVGGFRRDPAGRQCTLLDPAVGATCFDWHLQGWKWSSSGGFVNTWKREAFNGASDRTGMVHGIAMDPGGRYFYAVGCTNALGPHGSRGCFIASTKSEVDWHGQWQRWEISTGR